jgi:RNA polymerase sigma-70 factor (ECF subfamily)
MEDREVRDRRLVRSTLRGEAKAFGELMALYQGMVAGIAWRYGIRRDEIEDVVSEVFIKTHRNLARFRPEHRFGTWLYRLAVNHAVDHTRRTRRERARSEMPAQQADPSPHAGQRFERRERIELVRAAIRKVPPSYREALFLVYVEGMKLDEAARTLGLPQGTIKTRLMRGRQAMRKVLDRLHPGYFGE